MMSLGCNRATLTPEITNYEPIQATNVVNNLPNPRIVIVCSDHVYHTDGLLQGESRLVHCIRGVR